MTLNDFNIFIDYLLKNNYIYISEYLTNRIEKFKNNKTVNFNSFAFYVSDCCQTKAIHDLIVNTIGDRQILIFRYNNSNNDRIEYSFYPIPKSIVCELPDGEHNIDDMRYILKLSYKDGFVGDWCGGYNIDYSDMSIFNNQFAIAKKIISDVLRINNKIGKVDSTIVDRFLDEFRQIEAEKKAILEKYDAKLNEYNTFRNKIINAYNKELELDKDFE